MPDEDSTALVGMRPMEVTPARQEAMGRFFAMSLTQYDTVPAPDKMREFAAVAISLGLHPLAGEIMIYEKRLFITVDGRRRLAMRNPDYAAIQPDIVVDPAKRAAFGAVRPGDVLAICHLYRRSTPIPTIQYGMVRESERYPSAKEIEKLGVNPEIVIRARAAHDPQMILDNATIPDAKVRPVITQPAIMAMKRAEARALNAIAQAPLPTFDSEIGSPLEEGQNGEIVEGEIVESLAADPRPTVEEAVAAFNESRAAPPPTPREAEEEAEAEAEAEAPPVTEEPPAAPPVSTGPPPARAAKPPADQLPGGLLHIPDTPEKVIRHAVQHLHYRNIAAVLAALNFKAADEITDCAKSWADLVRLAPKAEA